MTVIGFFRLFERIGSALGPLLAAFLLHVLGYVSAIVAIGCDVGIGCMLLGLAWHFSARRRGERIPTSLQADIALPAQIEKV
ncbi:MAG: hypothetical protein ACXWVS_03980 [Hyphomicrobium sp.]